MQDATQDDSYPDSKSAYKYELENGRWKVYVAPARGLYNNWDYNKSIRVDVHDVYNVGYGDGKNAGYNQGFEDGKSQILAPTVSYTTSIYSGKDYTTHGRTVGTVFSSPQKGIAFISMDFLIPNAQGKIHSFTAYVTDSAGNVIYTFANGYNGDGNFSQEAVVNLDVGSQIVIGFVNWEPYETCNGNPWTPGTNRYYYDFTVRLFTPNI